LEFIVKDIPERNSRRRTESLARRPDLRIRCEEGIALSWEYKKALNNWGFAEINLRVSQLIPLGPANLEQLTESVRKAESKHIKARDEYVEHIANCLACSKKIVTL